MSNLTERTPNTADSGRVKHMSRCGGRDGEKGAAQCRSRTAAHTRRVVLR